MSLQDLLIKGRSNLSGRPYWQVRYKDGKTVSEWEVDWMLLNKKGLVEIRLVCPNGKIAVLGMQGKDCSDRLFQFKIARRGISHGKSFNSVESYVIGVIHGTDGQCICYAWEPEYVNSLGLVEESGRLLGPFEDCYHEMRYGGPVTSKLYSDLHGIKD